MFLLPPVQLSIASQLLPIRLRLSISVEHGVTDSEKPPYSPREETTGKKEGVKIMNERIAFPSHATTCHS